MKGRLVVSFVNEQGMLEAGLDYGGLVKEFLEQVATSCCSQFHSLPVTHEIAKLFKCMVYSDI